MRPQRKGTACEYRARKNKEYREINSLMKTGRTEEMGGREQIMCGSFTATFNQIFMLYCLIDHLCYPPPPYDLNICNQIPAYLCLIQYSACLCFAYSVVILINLLSNYTKQSRDIYTRLNLTLTDKCLT